MTEIFKKRYIVITLLSVFAGLLLTMSIKSNHKNAAK